MVGRRGTTLVLEQEQEPVQQNFDGAVDQDNVVDTNECSKLNSSNCVLVAADGSDVGDDKAAITNQLAENTESTDLSSSPAVSSEPLVIVPLQVVGAADRTEPISAPCLPPPVVYTKKVHAPVTVSAEDFARALTGVATVSSAQAAADAADNEAAHDPQLLGKKPETQHPTKHVKVKKTAKGCC